jgi:hypothetical protein
MTRLTMDNVFNQTSVSTSSTQSKKTISSDNVEEGVSKNHLKHLVTYNAHKNSVIGLAMADSEGDETVFSLSLDNTVKAWAMRHQPVN